MVEKLLKYPTVDPSVNESEALIMSMTKPAIARLLLKVDPSARNDEAVRIAVKNFQYSLASELSKEPRVKYKYNPPAVSEQNEPVCCHGSRYDPRTGFSCGRC